MPMTTIMIIAPDMMIAPDLSPRALSRGCLPKAFFLESHGTLAYNRRFELSLIPRKVSRGRSARLDQGCGGSEGESTAGCVKRSMKPRGSRTSRRILRPGGPTQKRSGSSMPATRVPYFPPKPTDSCGRLGLPLMAAGCPVRCLSGSVSSSVRWSSALGISSVTGDSR